VASGPSEPPRPPRSPSGPTTAASSVETPPKKDILVILTPEDWESWRRLRDFNAQYKLLCEWHNLVPKGLFTDKLLTDPDWEGLPAGRRATKMVDLLFKENVVRTYRVGNDYYIGFPYGLEVRDLDDYAHEVLAIFYADLLSVHAYTLAVRELKARARVLDEGALNPPDALLTERGVYSLRDLKLVPFDSVVDPLEFEKLAPIFTWRTPLRLDGFSVEDYSIESNAVYRAWRSHFDDRNWEYFTDAVGTWLSPFPYKLVVFLVGPPDCGKSTLLYVLTRPIRPYVASVSLRDLTSYQFGLEPLLGKWVNVRSEKGATVLKNLDVINTVFGGWEEPDVARKHRSHAKLKALKCGVFAMNELPVVTEVEAGTFEAFLDRLSIIEMRKPEGFEPVPDFALKVPPEEAFKFLVWCRWQLERRGWKVRRPEQEEMLDMLCNPFRRIEDWWNSRVVEDPDARLKGTEAYDDYRTFCLERGLQPLSRDAFYALLAKKAKRFEREGSVWFKGIRLLESVESRIKREDELLRELEALAP
jgi:energy-coupling factor transporter ATP-binding protein EcfA2